MLVIRLQIKYIYKYIYIYIYKEDEKGETEQQVASSLPKLSVKSSTFLRGTYIVSDKKVTISPVFW